MELDPIVMLAYVSVSLNVITVIAAVATYGVFWLRRRAKQQAPQQPKDIAQISDATPVFLRRYVPSQQQPASLAATGDETRLLA